MDVSLDAPQMIFAYICLPTRTRPFSLQIPAEILRTLCLPVLRAGIRPFVDGIIENKAGSHGVCFRQEISIYLGTHAFVGATVELMSQLHKRGIYYTF